MKRRGECSEGELKLGEYQDREKGVKVGITLDNYIPCNAIDDIRR